MPVTWARVSLSDGRVASCGGAVQVGSASASGCAAQVVAK